MAKNTDVSDTDLNRHLKKISEWVFKWKINFNPDPAKQAQEIGISRSANDQSPSLIFQSKYGCANLPSKTFRNAFRSQGSNNMGGRLKIKDNLQVGSLNKWIRIKIDFIFFLKGGRGGGGGHGVRKNLRVIGNRNDKKFQLRKMFSHNNQVS